MTLHPVLFIPPNTPLLPHLFFLPSICFPWHSQLAFKNGNILGKFIGAQPESGVKNFVEKMTESK